MVEIIKEIQADNYIHFNQLLEMFHPLIISWLYKIKVPAQDKEDYFSHAKIILLESAKNYDLTKQVPFPSYYKINLYHWYGNVMTKKKWSTTLYDQIPYESTLVDYDDKLLKEERIKKIRQLSYHLTKHEKIILNGLLADMSNKEIAQQMGLSKKTVLNKKYMLIKKLKEQISN